MDKHRVTLLKLQLIVLAPPPPLLRRLPPPPALSPLVPRLRFGRRRLGCQQRLDRSLLRVVAVHHSRELPLACPTAQLFRENVAVRSRTGPELSPSHRRRTAKISLRACRLFLGPGFRLAARWNRLVETVKTRKKREKNGGKKGRDTV